MLTSKVTVRPPLASKKPSPTEPVKVMEEASNDVRPNEPLVREPTLLPTAIIFAGAKFARFRTKVPLVGCVLPEKLKII